MGALWMWIHCSEEPKACFEGDNGFYQTGEQIDAREGGRKLPHQRKSPRPVLLCLGSKCEFTCRNQVSSLLLSVSRSHVHT